VPDDRWRLFYESDLQGLWSLLVVPALFLVYLALARGARERARSSAEGRFLLGYAIVFCVETLLDPIVTGPVALALDLSFEAHSAVMVAFVLLGDFRVLLLLFALGRPFPGLARSAGVAALATLVVPAVAFPANALLEWYRPELTGQRLWLLYETCFLLYAMVLREVVVPRITPDDARMRRFLQGVCGYVAVYYALWAGSDALILWGGLDAGWLLRALPNQLYYGLYVPFVWFTYLHFCHRGARPWEAR